MVSFTHKIHIFPLAFFVSVPVFSQENVPATEPPAIVAPAEIDARYTTTREMRDDAKLTLFFLERLHITQKKFDALDANEIIKSYFSALDPSKTIFLESDLDAMRERFAPNIKHFLREGNLHAAFTIYKVFQNRLNERVEWAQKRLEQPFDLETRKDILKLDRKLESWQPDVPAADKLWEQRLINDLINELISPKKSNDDAENGDAEKEDDAPIKPDLSPENVKNACKKISDRYGKLRKNLTLEPWEIEEIFLNSITTLFDPHTAFFSKQSMEEFQIMMRNSLCGIGAVLHDDDGYCTIRQIMPGGPLERSGKFSVGDRIIAVGQGDAKELTDVIGMRLNRVVRMLRGKKGEKVQLLVESSSDHSNRKLISLERDDIKLTEQLATAKIIDVPVGDAGTHVPVGVIELPSFYGKDRADKTAFSTSEDVKELLGKLKKHHIEAVVLDLRNNGGGYLNEAIDLAELFVGSNETVVQVKASNAKPEISKTGRKNFLSAAKNIFTTTLPDWNGPLIVLVSKASASASEIVAGALSDNARAIIVGDPQTHGKGSVQEIMPYKIAGEKYNASIKITRSKWYAPSGNSIQLKGVASDIPVPSIYSVLPVSESDLERPLAWDSIPSALPKNRTEREWLTAPISPELITTLKDASKKRQAELPEFLTLNRTIAWFENREKDKTVPLNIKDRLQARNEDKAFNKLIKSEYKAFEKTDYASKEIKLDSALAQEKESEENNSKKNAFNRNAAVQIPGGDAKDAEDWPEYDVVLRETVRIAADWAMLLDKQPAQAAK